MRALRWGIDFPQHFSMAVIHSASVISGSQRSASKHSPVVVGAGVGNSEGASVGDGEGASVGDGEGAYVGDGDGASVGDGEGASVGDGEGDLVGEGVGLVVGALVGFATKSKAQQTTDSTL